MIGWSSAMIERKHRVPATLPWQLGPIWYEELNEQLRPTVSLTSYHRRDRGFLCPQIDIDFPTAIAPTRYIGYAVNLRWRRGLALGESYGENWDEITAPSRFPWFSDSDVLLSGAAASMRLHFGQGSAPDWRVGFHHAQGKSTQAAHADGHVGSHARDDLVKVDNDGVSQWLTWY